MDNYCAVIFKDNENKQLAAAMSAVFIEDWIRFGLCKAGITDITVYDENTSGNLAEYANSFATLNNKKYVCIIPYSVPYISNEDLVGALITCRKEHIPVIAKDISETRITFAAMPVDMIIKSLSDNLQSLNDLPMIRRIYVKCRVTYDQESLFDFVLFAKERMIKHYLSCGVYIVSGDGVMISAGTNIGAGTVILPGTTIIGKSSIGENCIIGPNSFIKDTCIGNGVSFKSSFSDSSTVGNECIIGPYANLRPNSNIANRVKIGDFVEIKNSTIGEKTSVSHLTYIGDSDVGCRVNFGCGVVTVNYDGKNKYRTTIGNDVFVGCNTNLISPVKVNDNAYIAAGSTITHDIPEYALAIARERQINKENWVRKSNKNREGSPVEQNK